MKEIRDDLKNITYTYTYDQLHRLLGETNTGAYAPQSYTYDALGDITSKTVGTTTYAYSYANTAHKHAVSSITYNNTAYAYSYDANGNMTAGPDFTDPAAVGSRTITYNTDNMPINISYTKSGSTVASAFTYDAAGIRAMKTAGSSTTYYVNANYEVKDGVVTKYIMAANARIAVINPQGTSYFHTDHLGSSSVMTNSSGTKVESTEFSPFGTMRDHTGTVVTNYKYTGQELDPESTLYYYVSRYYDPMIGRFISPDSIIPDVYNPQALNPYSYCRNNPLIYTDPDGHEDAPAPSGGDDGLVPGENYSPANNTLMSGMDTTLAYMASTGAYSGYASACGNYNGANSAPGPSSAVVQIPQSMLTPFSNLYANINAKTFTLNNAYDSNLTNALAVQNDQAKSKDVIGNLTVGIGLTADVLIGPVNMNFSAGVLIDKSGNWGTYSTQGLGEGAGARASAGLSLWSSNAQNITDMSRGFMQVSAGGGWGAYGAGQGFIGDSEHGKVCGGGVIAGLGYGAGGSTGGTYTTVTQQGRLW